VDGEQLKLTVDQEVGGSSPPSCTRLAPQAPTTIRALLSAPSRLADQTVTAMRFLLFVTVAMGVLLWCGHGRAQPFEALQHGLDVRAPDGLVAQGADLAEAMRTLHIPSVTSL
jgi:hypothetical protein